MERVLQGRYKIEEPLGVGGSSQVYLARDQALNRDVALKVLDQEAAADGNLRRMFVKEARALAQLSHPNIVAVYDVGDVDGSPFIVMEYLPGGSLKERIEHSGPLKAGDGVRIAIEVANGLAFAHSKGIIHADLKPSNILFDANDTAKICDFGIARTPQEEAETPQLYATAMYVAPERIEGKSASVQSDIYGLGLVLYEALVGKPPFTSSNASVLLRDHVVRQPVPPSHLRPSLPKEVDSIVLKALAKQPNLRYQKATEFATALQRIENIDKELATTRIVVMTDPLAEFQPRAEQSPVVALFMNYGQPLRRLFFSLFAALPVFAMATLAGVEVVGALLASGLVAVVSLAGQLGIALAITWVMVSAFTFVFVPGLALAFAILGVFLWARSTPPEQIALALAIPVVTPLGLAPAMILTGAAVFGLAGVLTVGASAALTMVIALAMGVQSLGPFAQTGLSLRQESLFNPVRAIETKSALLAVIQHPNDRFGPLLTQLDPAVLWNQMTAVVSRLASSTLETWVATVLAWTMAALTVWTVTRLLRTFFDALLRTRKWFALYVFAAAAGVAAGAIILFMLNVTLTMLDNAADRPANGVLFLSALVGAILALAAAVIIGASEKPTEEQPESIPLSARRMPVR